MTAQITFRKFPIVSLKHILNQKLKVPNDFSTAKNIKKKTPTNKHPLKKSTDYSFLPENGGGTLGSNETALLSYN